MAAPCFPKRKSPTPDRILLLSQPIPQKGVHDSQLAFRTHEREGPKGPDKTTGLNNLQKTLGLHKHTAKNAAAVYPHLRWVHTTSCQPAFLDSQVAALFSHGCWFLGLKWMEKSDRNWRSRFALVGSPSFQHVTAHSVVDQRPRGPWPRHSEFLPTRSRGW